MKQKQKEFHKKGKQKKTEAADTKTQRFFAEIFISWKKFQDCSSTNNVHGLNELQTEWSDDYRLSADKKNLLVLNWIVLNDFVMKGSHHLESTELSVESFNPCQ